MDASQVRTGAAGFDCGSRQAGCNCKLCAYTVGTPWLLPLSRTDTLCYPRAGILKFAVHGSDHSRMHSLILWLLLILAGLLIACQVFYLRMRRAESVRSAVKSLQ